MKYFKSKTEKKLTQNWDCSSPEESSYTEISPKEAKILAQSRPNSDGFEYELTGDKAFLRNFRATSPDRWENYSENGKDYTYDHHKKRRYSR